MSEIITVKKLTLICQQHEKVKKSCRGISETLSDMCELLSIFNIHETHPLMLGAKEAVKDYHRLTITIGKMQRIIKQIETELITVDEN